MSRLRAAAAATLAATALAGPAAAATDPAAVALRTRDAYASPPALGAGAAAAAERRLAEAARGLREDGRPVKLAIVRGPAGAPSMRAYAAGLRRALGGDDTVVVTAPSRPVVAVGGRTPAEMTRRLRAARAGRLADPAARVIAAAQAVAPDPTGGGTNLRKLGALLGVAVLGGVWAVAIGLRRERLRARRRDDEARQALHVRADALGAQIRRLAGDGAAAGDDELRVARERHSGAAGRLMAARDAAALREVRLALEEGAAALAAARRRAGRAPLEGPFEGLCATDPGHGPAEDPAPDGGPPLCAECHRRAAAGEPLGPRLVTRDGRPVPYAAAAEDAPPA